MAKRGKIYKQNAKKVESDKKYSLDEALASLEGFEARKFDETIDVAFNLGVDPKHSDQMVRGATTLPHGIGKSIRVLAVATGEAAKQAQQAGADEVGHADVIEKIQKGWLEFDRVVATPETLKDLTKVARMLGPKGLMPSKKTGTVTDDIAKAVSEQKKGRVEYKVEKAGVLHAVIGKKSFGSSKLKENFMTLFENVMKQKPSSSKGVYLKKASLSPSMGPSFVLDTAKLDAIAKAF